MTVTTTGETGTAPDVDEAPDTAAPAPESLVESDLLVEDVSIDGMCGVY
jgi:mycofactocin precursor